MISLLLKGHDMAMENHMATDVQHFEHTFVQVDAMPIKQSQTARPYGVTCGPLDVGRTCA
jgi:hypothetical protein